MLHPSVAKGIPFFCTLGVRDAENVPGYLNPIPYPNPIVAASALMLLLRQG